MSDGQLSIGAGLFLLFIGLIIDGLQFALNWIYIGIIVNPVLLTPLAWLIFAIVLDHNNMSMFSGKRAWAGWLTLGAEFFPGLDGFIPGWTVYAVFLMVAPRVMALAQRIM